MRQGRHARLAVLRARLSAPLRGTAAAALVLLAFHRSLWSLVQNLSYESPVAYLALVPVLALAAMAVLARRPRPGELAPLPTRHVDWTVGLGLMAFALWIALALPRALSYGFWTARLDMLALPLFCAGLLLVLFGGRLLSRVRWCIPFLLLAWPLPYDVLLDPLFRATSSATIATLRQLAPHLAGVRALPGSLFAVHSPAESFALNVAPTCAGVNTSVGFLLVGLAAMLVVQGPFERKLLWLTLGVVLVWVLNVLRIMTILAAGAHLGQAFAMDVLHPYIGLAVFTLACTGMALLLPAFGLTALAASDTVRQALPLRRLHPMAVLVSTLVAALLGTANAGLASLQPYAGASTAVSARGLEASQLTLAGWRGGQYDRIAWAPQYFGRGATWRRYSLRDDAGSLSFVDVVRSFDLTSFSTYGLEACYRFHGGRVLHRGQVGIGAPVPAEEITYVESGGRHTWSVLAWVWPVRTGTSAKAYERVVILQSRLGALRLRDHSVQTMARQERALARAFTRQQTLHRAVGASTT